ncbi:hypothetical protein [Consotaella salsifontis]|uniref:hypothetical protein n=1 Tax=Consotaella salsifontis TaxID=1365950 RepID=UPI00105477BF|nr:hypothetical protein [Consotaella salsifontis]
MIREADDLARGQDPVLQEFAGLTSLAHSIVLRHGQAAATALARIIEVSGPHFQVLTEEKIPLTAAAEAAVIANAPHRLHQVDLPHDQGVRGSYRCDIVLLCEKVGYGVLIEVKRGASSRSHKAMLRRLEIARLAARFHLQQKSRISRVEAVIIDLHGTESAPGVILRDQIDDFFGLPITRQLDRFDAIYRARARSALVRRYENLSQALTPASVNISGDGQSQAAASAVGDEDAGDNPIGPARILAARQRQSGGLHVVGGAQ